MRNGSAAHKNIEAPRVFDQRHSRIVIPTEAEEFFRWPYDAGLLDEENGEIPCGREVRNPVFYACGYSK